MRRGARDRGRRVAVEVEPGAGRDSFDGNHTSSLVSWLIPAVGSCYNPLDEEQLSALMGWTVSGHLAWTVFPIDNVAHAD